MTLDLEAIEKRCEAATPGPWKPCAHLRPGCSCTCGYRGGIWSGDGESLVCEMGNDPADPIPPAPLPCEQSLKDADFIAAARNDVPAMIARVRELEAALEAIANESSTSTGLVEAYESRQRMLKRARLALEYAEKKP